MLLLIFAISTIIFALHRYLTANYDYWKKRGVPSPPVSVLFGNLKDSVFVRKSLGQLYHKIYDDYPEFLYVGFFKFRKPAVLVRDAKLVQEVMIKNFSSFHDNDVDIDEKVDPIFSRNPFAKKGDEWKVSRGQITPCFTGKRMKPLCPLIEEVGRNLVKHVSENPDATGQDGIETKELAAKFTTDVVASCAFGLDGKAFVDPKSEFREIGRKIFTPSFKMALVQLCVLIAPPLAKFLNLKFIPDETERYFHRIINQTLKYRRDHNIVRGDFLDIMTELKAKLGEGAFNNDHIAAHAAGFFSDGFETSSITLSFALYELAANPHVQARLYEEVAEVTRRTGGKMEFDDIQNMVYLDQVVMESLRKHPPGAFMNKVCTKGFMFPAPDYEEKGREVLIEAGTSVIISIDGIHGDPQYYNDPEKFDPDRFSEENKANMIKCTFLGFGEGPRICLGQRFGLTQVKIALINVLENFEVRVNKKTIVPIQIDPQFFMRKAVGGIWLNYYKRN